ncbi:hypothetical protein [Agromyces sp. Marseille-P2726]|uniref:hypothetical protein n=1 Tax=Agromyces sp. Marseille-P2726 TaxID=2709132 RepID=UPI00156DF2D3|nr:hypothetical protein [Agromyces sp. Marseille-P2726]
MSALTSSAAISAPAELDGRAVRVPGRRIAELLLVRLALFAVFQAVIAGLLAVGGTADPWAASAAWWPLTATAANLVNLGLLARYLRLDGSSIASLYRVRRETLGRDILTTLGIVAIAAPLAALPNIGLAAWLFGDPQVALDLFVQPLPMWAAIAGLVLFPITTALAELPTYYGYVQPHLARLTRSAWLIVLLPALVHAFQHAALPLIFDTEFIMWRALMFLPFALLLSIALRWRPRVLPYLLVVHFALDLQAVLMVVAAS